MLEIVQSLTPQTSRTGSRNSGESLNTASDLVNLIPFSATAESVQMLGYREDRSTRRSSSVILLLQTTQGSFSWWQRTAHLVSQAFPGLSYHIDRDPVFTTLSRDGKSKFCFSLTALTGEKILCYCEKKETSLRACFLVRIFLSCAFLHPSIP